MLYAIPALLDAEFCVGVFTENPKFLENFPPDIRNRIKALYIRGTSAFPKFVYLHLIFEWIKMKKLQGIARNYDIIFNVRARNLYDPIFSSDAKAVYHLYGPMITHWHAYKEYPQNLMKAYFLLLDKIFLNRCKKAVVLANSHFTRRVLARQGIVSEVVYPPCEISDLNPLQRKNNQVISVARIAIEKKLEDFITIARHFSNVKFIILGEVNVKDLTYYHRLEKLKTSNVNIVTPSHNKFREFLRKHLAESKIYLHSAYDEPFGITIVEAMASGCIPIVRNSGGPVEIVTKEVGFKWNSIREAVTQISRILSDKDLQEKLSFGAIQRAQTFNPEVFQEKIIEIIQKL